MYLVNGNKKFGTLEFFQVMTLIKPPILMIPNGTDPFTMYSDTSKKGCGASLW